MSSTFACLAMPDLNAASCCSWENPGMNPSRDLPDPPRAFGRVRPTTELIKSTKVQLSGSRSLSHPFLLNAMMKALCKNVSLKCCNEQRPSCRRVLFCGILETWAQFNSIQNIIFFPPSAIKSTCSSCTQTQNNSDRIKQTKYTK